MKFNKNNFDEIGYRANWAPIYFEPMLGSGERITIGIVISDENGFEITKAIHDSTIKKLFGPKSKFILEMINFVISGFNEIKEISKENIDFPITGFSKGNWNIASSRELRAGVLKQAIYQSASLYSTALTEEKVRDRITDSNSRFASKVKSSILKIRPEFSNCFDVPVNLVSNGFPPKLNFLYRKHATNIGQLNPRNVNSSFRFLRAKLHELHQARQTEKIKFGTLLISSGSADMSTNDNNSNDVTRALRELEHESKLDELRLVVARDHKHASSLILSIADAA